MKERGQGQTNAADEGEGRHGRWGGVWGVNYCQLLQFKNSKVAKINKICNCSEIISDQSALVTAVKNHTSKKGHKQ